MHHSHSKCQLVLEAGRSHPDRRGPDASRRLHSSTSPGSWLRFSSATHRIATRIVNGALPLGCFNVSYMTSKRNYLAWLVGLPAICLVQGCAAPTITQSGALSSYSDLEPTKKGRTTMSRVRINQVDVLAARTVRILPTRFADAVGANISQKNRGLVANAIDRSVCRGLSKRFNVVEGAEPADLLIQATITHLGTTNKIAAGASAVAGFIPSALSSIPLINPRVPIGLGSLTVEVEALDRENMQDAAFVWASGANSIRSTTRVSEVGDAYELATDFGDKFSQILVAGEKPSRKLRLPTLPKIGGSKMDASCDVFGKSPGIFGAITANLALPPSVADKGGKPREASSVAAPDRIFIPVEKEVPPVQ